MPIIKLIRADVDINPILLPLNDIADCVERTVQDDLLNTTREIEPPKLLKEELRQMLLLESVRNYRKEPYRRVIRGVCYSVTGEGDNQRVDPVPEIVDELPDATEPATDYKRKSRHLFSPALAKEINSKRPDVTAAILIYGLMLWQNNRYAQTMINGKRHSFRSLNELCEDHPYLKRGQILKALHRAEEKLKGRFQIINDREKLYFHVDDYMKKLQMNDKTIGFNPDRAVDCGVVGGVIMQNLEYQLAHFTFPKTDDVGNCYGSLRPRELSKHLPFSEDTIARTLKDLCKNEKGLVAHPVTKHFYAMRELFHAPKTHEACAAKVTSNAAKVTTCAAKVTNLLWPYSNEYSNSNCKGYTTNPAEAPPVRIREQSNKLSSDGLKYLALVGEQILQKFRNQSLSTSGMKPKVIRVKPSELPYDDVTSADFDLPYDFIPSKKGNSRPFFGKQWLKNRVEEITLYWRCAGFKYTKKDIGRLRRFLQDNPHLPDDFFEQIHQQLDPEHNWMRLGDWKAKKGKYDGIRFLRRVKNAKALLQYLPQIVHQMFMSPEMVDGKIEFTGKMEEPFASLNYAYLEKIPNSRLVTLDYF